MRDGPFARRIELRRRLLPLLLTVGIGGVVLTPATVASGAPEQSLEEQAAALQDKVEQLGEEAAALGEKWNEAQLQVDAANADIADAEAGIVAAEYEMDGLQGQLNSRASALYRGAGTQGPIDIVDADNVQDLASRTKYADVARDNDQDLIDEASAAQDDLEKEQATAEAVRDEAAAAVAELEAAKSAAESKLAEQEALLEGVEGELAAAREAEAAARRAADPPAPTNASTPPPGGGDPNYSPPPPGAGAAAAVDFAYAQLGKPYCYAGVGPDCFDCSGLVTAAYGMTLPHGSDTIHAMYPHVPMDQLQPGDVVWNPGHDGIYVGGGIAIHATHTGDFVRTIEVSYFSEAARIV